MVSDRNALLGQALVRSFPPLRWALRAQDALFYVITLVGRLLARFLKATFALVNQLTSRLLACLSRLTTGNGYERLDKKELKVHSEPIPYRDNPTKRCLTYQGGLALGAFMYLFLYYVLVKHHTLLTITVAFLLMIVYMIILENSHTIRSILMLCLPIIFTNRGRALVFCSMLGMMTSGPLNNTNSNIGELHMSINCCKQYLIIKADQYVDQNVIQDVVKVETAIYQLIDSIKQFADELQEKFTLILQMAITVERYIELCIRKLIDIINVCNTHTNEIQDNCRYNLEYAYADCNAKLMGVRLTPLCEIVRPLKNICSTIRLPEVLCKLPRAIANYLDQAIGQRLRLYINQIRNEFYFKVDIEHDYSYNETKSKPYKQVLDEIRQDVERKFWYIHFVTRVFNLLSLIIVSWILVTAVLYHMHYLSEYNYDNMYIDGYLREIDKSRKRKGSKVRLELESIDWKTADLDDETLPEKSPSDLSIKEQDEAQQVDLRGSYLFPMPPEQEEQYLRPFSLRMNEMERSKLLLASLVWLAIVGFVFFFVLVDFSLYSLIETVDNLLDEILFKSDLPLVDVQSKAGDKVITYNRTYLASLRQAQKSRSNLNKATYTNRTGSLSGLYRRLMDSIEQNIPDDVAILDSLRQCLPRVSRPNFYIYKLLAYLAAFTFAAVLVEAYALRTRHCLANLYYPARARLRALWLYRKLLTERPKFLNPAAEQPPAAAAKKRATQLRRDNSDNAKRRRKRKPT